MFYKRKWIILLISGILLVLWGFFTYDINQRFPNPENIGVKQGETVDYKGIKLTAGEIEIYDGQELLKHYPEVENVDDYVDDEELEYKNRNKDCYFIIHVSMENVTDNVWEAGKEGLVTWTLEAGNHAQGVGLEDFLCINPDSRSTLEPGEKQDLKYIYRMPEEWMTVEEAGKVDKKVIYSYYPSKNYLYYPGED